jgi:hypothetical protein
MEIHFVHINPAGKYAVLGIMMELDMNNQNSTFFKPIVDALGSIPNLNDKVTLAALNVSQALHEANYLQSGFFTYLGSLTTPPCTEGVNWHVAIDSIKISASQFNAVQNMIGYSARATQRREFEDPGAWANAGEVKTFDQWGVARWGSGSFVEEEEPMDNDGEPEEEGTKTVSINRSTVTQAATNKNSKSDADQPQAYGFSFLAMLLGLFI